MRYVMGRRQFGKPPASPDRASGWFAPRGAALGVESIHTFETTATMRTHIVGATSPRSPPHVTAVPNAFFQAW
jgi:hypothetical protein